MVRENNGFEWSCKIRININNYKTVQLKLHDNNREIPLQEWSCYEKIHKK